MYTYIFIYVHVYIYIYINECQYVYTYIYIHTIQCLYTYVLRVHYRSRKGVGSYEPLRLHRIDTPLETHTENSRIDWKSIEWICLDPVSRPFSVATVGLFRRDCGILPKPNDFPQWCQCLCCHFRSIWKTKNIHPFLGLGLPSTVAIWTSNRTH